MGARKDGIYEVDETGPGGPTHVIVDSGVVSITGTVVLGANSGVDIGDVTINNGPGANAVNIQDGGNSITVDGNFLTDAQLRASPVPVSGSFVLTPSGTQDVNLISVSGAAVTLGQKAMAASIPVVLSSDQTDIRVVSGGVALSVAGGPILIGGTGKGTTTPLTVTATASGTNHNAFDVILYNSAGFLFGSAAAPISVISTGNPLLISGGKSNNATIPDAFNLGVLSALANLNNPTLTEGFVNLLSVDLSGNLRTISPSVPVPGSDLNNLLINALTTQRDALELILRELRVMSMYLQSGLNVPDDVEQVREDIDITLPSSVN